MQIDWVPTATVAAFTLVGGWLASRAIGALAQRAPSLPPTIAACGILGMWTFHVVFGSTAFLLSLCLAWGLLVLAIVDWFDFRLPDLLTLPLIGGGLIAATLLPAESLLEHVGAAAAGYGSLWVIAWMYRRVRGQEGLGLGDAKLAAAAGAWLGFGPLPSVLLLGSVVGILWVVIAAVVHGRAEFSKRIPFGVPLSFAIWIVWLYGPLAFASMS
jgi:leader peptidase (prepilin peptidase)/N-methyltransferase